MLLRPISGYGLRQCPRYSGHRMHIISQVSASSQPVDKKNMHITIIKIMPISIPEDSAKENCKVEQKVPVFLTVKPIEFEIPRTWRTFYLPYLQLLPFFQTPILFPFLIRHNSKHYMYPDVQYLFQCLESAKALG